MAEKCGSCDQMKKENSQIRKAIIDTNKNYVEVVNENLEKRREIDRLKIIVEDLNKLVEVYKGQRFIAFPPEPIPCAVALKPEVETFKPCPNHTGHGKYNNVTCNCESYLYSNACGTGNHYRCDYADCRCERCHIVDEDPPPVPLKADPTLITYPKIFGAPKKYGSLADSFPERTPIWKRFLDSLQQGKDKWK